MRVIRLCLWLAVCAATLAYVYLSFFRTPANDAQPVILVDAARIGGPFSLTASDGRTVTQADLAGTPHAVFFGFTHCPDVCPTTLFQLGEMMKQLGPEGERLRALFVTVDPERDTAEQLATYMSAFDPRITAVTGSPEAIAQMAKNYAAFYRKVPVEGGYTMDHTALVFLMGPDGRFVTTLDLHEPAEVQLGKLRRLARMN